MSAYWQIAEDLAREIAVRVEPLEVAAHRHGHVRVAVGEEEVVHARFKNVQMLYVNKKKWKRRSSSEQTHLIVVVLQGRVLSYSVCYTESNASDNMNTRTIVEEHVIRCHLVILAKRDVEDEAVRDLALALVEELFRAAEVFLYKLAMIKIVIIVYLFEQTAAGSEAGAILVMHPRELAQEGGRVVL